MEHNARSLVTLARDARQTAEAMQLAERTRCAYKGATDGEGVLRRLAQVLDTWRYYRRRKIESAAAARPLEACATELVELHLIGGVPTHHLRTFPKLLDEVLDDLDVGQSRASVDVLDEENQTIEAAGQECFTRRRIHGASSEELEQEIKHHERDAQVSQQLARALRRELQRRARETGTFVRPMGVAVACAR